MSRALHRKEKNKANKRTPKAEVNRKQIQGGKPTAREVTSAAVQRHSHPIHVHVRVYVHVHVNVYVHVNVSWD